MGIRDATTVDMILERPPFETENCELILMIIDATSDVPDQERLGMLIAKLAAYVAYVRSPLLAKSYPKIKPADVIVRVLTVIPPTFDMQRVDAVRSPDGKVRLRVFSKIITTTWPKCAAPVASGPRRIELRGPIENRKSKTENPPARWTNPLLSVTFTIFERPGRL